MGTKRRPIAIVALLTAGVGLVVLAAFASRRTPVEAVQTTATAISNLTAEACHNGQQLDVSFPWKGREVVAADSAACARGYVAGEQVTI